MCSLITRNWGSPVAVRLPGGSEPETCEVEVSKPNIHSGWFNVMPVAPKKSTTSNAAMLA